MAEFIHPGSNSNGLSVCLLLQFEAMTQQGFVAGLGGLYRLESAGGGGAFISNNLTSLGAASPSTKAQMGKGGAAGRAWGTQPRPV